MIALWIGTVLAGIFVAALFIKLYLDKLYSYQITALQESLDDYKLAYGRSIDKHERLKQQYKLLRSEMLDKETE